MKIIEMEEIESLERMLMAKKYVIEQAHLYFQYLQEQDDIRYGEYLSSKMDGSDRTKDVINQFVEDAEPYIKDYTTCFVLIETLEDSGILMEELQSFKNIAEKLNNEVILMWSYAISTDIAPRQCKMTVVLSK